MNARVMSLRDKSLRAVPSISIERATIVTEVYEDYFGKVSLPMLRALTLQALCERKTIYIDPEELIVGERGPSPAATPTYPELCCHSVEDLKTVDMRPIVNFKVDAESLKTHEERIIPYWTGKSMRDKIMEQMTEQWKDCYYSGLFTEFMEQRAPGHTVGDDKIFKQGLNDAMARIDEALAKLDYIHDPEAVDKQEELKAMKLACQSVIRFAQRHGELALEMAVKENDPVRKAELEKLAEICFHIPANKPRTFHEALQNYWFLHISIITELNIWDAFDPGRLDQHLNPFYQAGLVDGSLDAEKAKELLQCFWIKFNNQPSPPKTGVTLAESGTYTDFANINSGGLTIDGRDGVNDVTYLVLDVIDEMRLLQPSSNIQLSKKNPDQFLKRALHIIKKGWGQPSIFNADAVVEELVRQGKSIEDARCGGTSGCVEAGAFGKEAFVLTGYLNLVKIFEITLNNGLDTRTGKLLGIETGDPRTFTSYEQLMEAFKKQLHHFVEIKVRGNNVIERLYAQHMPAPLMSVVIDDCISKGKNYNAGGARYNTRYIQGVGIGTLTDSFSAIKHHVFDLKKVTMDELMDALKLNYGGHEAMRQMFLNKTPRYGNDNDAADEIMQSLFNAYYDEVNGRKTLSGGNYRINMLPTTCHVYFGEVTGATPDGRKAGMPQSEGISPVQGTDRNGPTGVIKSAGKMDHLRTGGTLLNLKFTPSLLETDEGIDKVVGLVRAYFKLDGHHIQFNVCSAETLRKAQENPEENHDLIVRVAGYSDYFNHLSKTLQDEVIARTEHQAF